MANLLKASNGKVSLRFMEPMEEVNYIDQLRWWRWIIRREWR